MTDFKLKRRRGFEGVTGPLLLVILDGVGLYRGRAEGYDGNAVDLAATPNLDRILAEAPVSISLKAHGTAVGLPGDGDMGNSEVGHNAIGAGRIFEQGAKLVGRAIAKGFAADQTSAVLVQEGLPNHMVEVGGEVRARGVNGLGEAWKIGFLRLRFGRGARLVVDAHDRVLSARKLWIAFAAEVAGVEVKAVGQPLALPASCRPHRLPDCRCRSPVQAPSRGKPPYAGFSQRRRKPRPAAAAG